MLTKEKLRKMQKYLVAYKTTTGEFLDDNSEYNSPELNNLISLLQGEIYDLSQTPINLKPCNDDERFDIDYGYSKELDMTFVIRRKFKNDEITGEEVCGFYHGEPDLKFVHDYINEPYWEDESLVED